MKTYLTKSAEETIALGKKTGQNLQKGEIVCLYGELGSGKTTFIQGLAAGLGIDKRLISPTFIILRTYEIKNQTSKTLCHVDLYRIHSEDDIKGIGLDEIIKNGEDIVAVEWAEKLRGLLPKKRIDIHFKPKNEERKITIEEKNE